MCIRDRTRGLRMRGKSSSRKFLGRLPGAFLVLPAAGQPSRIQFRREKGGDTCKAVCQKKPTGLIHLPARPRQPGDRLEKCLWCKVVFPETRVCSIHMKTRMHMPYQMWLARTRYCNEVEGAPHPRRTAGPDLRRQGGQHVMPE
eukprot:7375955-Pyramimonas_sp.AAC.1